MVTTGSVTTGSCVSSINSSDAVGVVSKTEVTTGSYDPFGYPKSSSCSSPEAINLFCKGLKPEGNVPWFVEVALVVVTAGVAANVSAAVASS